MWREGSPCALLVGLQTGAATVETVCSFLQELKNRTTFWLLRIYKLLSYFFSSGSVISVERFLQMQWGYIFPFLHLKTMQPGIQTSRGTADLQPPAVFRRKGQVQWLSMLHFPKEISITFRNGSPNLMIGCVYFVYSFFFFLATPLSPNSMNTIVVSLMFSQSSSAKHPHHFSCSIFFNNRYSNRVHFMIMCVQGNICLLNTF